MARSVKFLGKLEATLSDQETREGWWEELRDEIKSHARTVCCTHVIGYIETCTIFGEWWMYYSFLRSRTTRISYQSCHICFPTVPCFCNGVS